MQDLKALEGKSLAELREIAKVLGIKNVMVKKRELIEKIAGTDSPKEAPAENKDEAKG
ncbi:MAG: transcription termination factor Rho, partial [Alistipes shahii]|nr:transcription termination factor Rho [Alistipes shahii]